MQFLLGKKRLKKKKNNDEDKMDDGGVSWEKKLFFIDVIIMEKFMLLLLVFFVNFFFLGIFGVFGSVCIGDGFLWIDQLRGRLRFDVEIDLIKLFIINYNIVKKVIFDDKDVIIVIGFLVLYCCFYGCRGNGQVN